MSKKAFIVDYFAAFKVDNPEKGRRRVHSSDGVRIGVDSERLAIQKPNSRSGSAAARRLQQAAQPILARIPGAGSGGSG